MVTSRRDLTVIGYMPGEVQHVWCCVAPLIQKALDRNSDYTLDEVHDGLMSGDMQLWAYKPDRVRAALVTKIESNSTGKWCLLLAAGGEDAKEWLPYAESLEDWARSNGCDEMRIYGRRGWARLAGYREDWTRMSKRL